MAEDPPKDPEIQEILSDLDAILSDLKPGETPPAKPPAPVPAQPPAPAAKPASPPAPSAPPPAAKPPVAAPAPVPSARPPAAVPPPPALTIKLDLPAVPPPAAPPPAAKAAPPPLSVVPPAAAAPAAPPPVPAPAAPPPAPAVKVPAPAAAAAKPAAPAPGVIPEDAPKEQIRRIAIVFTPNYSAEKDAFVQSLDAAAANVSKKPLYLRKAYSEILTPTTNLRLFAEKLRSVGAVAVVGVLEGLPEAKQKELAEVMAEAGFLCRIAQPAEVQKRSLAVDTVVDMMLLAPES